MMKVWIIYDARAWADPASALVMCAYNSYHSTLDEVEIDRSQLWPDGVIFEYDQRIGADGTTFLENERLIG